MKSDIFHAYDPTSVRESTVGLRMSRSPEAINFSAQASSPQIGYKLPFFIGSRAFLTHEGQHSEQMRHHESEEERL
jgi:hypothetical protein